MNHYVALHPKPTQFISDWVMSHNGTQSAVKIDGAIIDPQFMRSFPVALVCSSAKQAAGIKHLILDASLITPTFTKA